MIPIIIAIVVAAGIAVAALNWDEITKALKGKKLAVLGEQRVGKTYLIDFLTTGSIPKKYEADSYAREVPGRRFELRDLKLCQALWMITPNGKRSPMNIPPLKHLSGSVDDYAQWKEVTNEADIVLYLLRVDRLMTGHEPTENRVRKDMGQIRRWLQTESKDFPLFIIGTHCDLTDPDFTTLPSDQRQNYRSKVREMPIFREVVRLGGGGRRVRFVLGSLKSMITTEQLVYDLFGEIRELI